MKPDYDVLIMGGGLAGLALSIQLKRANPELSILILERREGAAATAAHKVGESTVELGSYYLRNVLGLKDYLEEHELPKHGLRFFFPSHDKKEISTRVELGPRELLKVKSHQLDRGTLENYMTKHTQSLGTRVINGGIAKDVDFGKDMHVVKYKYQGEEREVTGRWVVDASSRVSILKRKMGFQKPMEHHSNAVWWRVKGVVDIDDWSDNKEWKNYLSPGLRYLSTVHFMDKGYWFWVIPLGSKNTSLGIVTDPAYHPLETHNTYEKAMEWLKVNEPRAYEVLSPHPENVLDFLVLKHYAHHSGRIYSGDERWAVTGEAGAFLDPFYSPGTDFISMNNTWLSDLILRDMQGEDIEARARIYEQSHLSLVDFWLPIYQNKYQLMGSTQVMSVKIFWDWAIYWAVTSKLFTSKGLTDLSVLKRLFATEGGVGSKFGALSNVMQAMFIEWNKYDTAMFSDRYVDVFDVPFMLKLQSEIEDQHGPKELLDKVAENMKILESMAVTIFQYAANMAKGLPMDMAIDPYKFSLEADPDTYTGEGAMQPDSAVKEQLKTLWFYKLEEAAV